MKVLFLLFIVLPVAELMVLIKVGSIIGVLYTAMLILLTAMIGATLLRKQGMETLLRANQRLQNGEIPAAEVFQGFLLALGGAFLLTPGFVTDALGFALLLPQARQYLAVRLMKNMEKPNGFRVYSTFDASQAGGFQSGDGPDVFSTGRSAHRTAQDGEIIDAEFEEVNETLPIKKPDTMKK